MTRFAGYADVAKMEDRSRAGLLLRGRRALGSLIVTSMKRREGARLLPVMRGAYAVTYFR